MFPSDVNWVHLQPDVNPEIPETICKKMLRSIKGIIFDFDGTIFDNARIASRLVAAYPPDWFYLWKERLVRTRYSGRDFLSPDEYYKAFFADLGKACHRSPDKIRNWYFNRYMPRMVRVLKKCYKPRPGVDELFKCMEKSTCSVKVAIFSDYPFVKERMNSIGLTTTEKIQYYGLNSFGAQKPAVRPFLDIAKNLGLHPEEILVIGDREDTDGLGAFHAGMHFFCLETGHKRYAHFDPNRRPKNEEAQGPTLLMYAGKWDDLFKLLIEKFNN